MSWQSVQRQWRRKVAIDRILRAVFVIPFGRLRKPLPIAWEDDYSLATDSIVKNGAPVCPRCREHAYREDRCVFCGQRFAGWKQFSLFSRIRLWFTGGKHCRYCCLFCGYARECYDDLITGGQDHGE